MKPYTAQSYYILDGKFFIDFDKILKNMHSFYGPIQYLFLICLYWFDHFYFIDTNNVGI